jgi:hypothetical protein
MEKFGFSDDEEDEIKIGVKQVTAKKQTSVA